MDQTGCWRTKEACSSKGASNKHREGAQADTRRNAKKDIRAWRIIGFARVGGPFSAALRSSGPTKSWRRAARQRGGAQTRPGAAHDRARETRYDNQSYTSNRTHWAVEFR